MAKTDLQPATSPPASRPFLPFLLLLFAGSVLLGQDGATRVDVDLLQQRLERPDHASVARSLEEVGFHSSVGLFRTYAGQAADLQPWLANAEINRDRNLRLQYLAGMSLNVYHSQLIYDEMLSYRKSSEELFVGSGIRARTLRAALKLQPSGH
jgi:spermidine synthase